jgi:small conductance mechanosensitive channel
MAISLESIFHISKIFSGYFVRISTVFIVLLIGFILARFLGKVTKKIFVYLKINEVITKKGTKISTGFIVSTSIEYLVYLFSIIFALNELGLSTIVINIILLCIAVLSIILITTIAVLGINGFSANILAGIYIYVTGRVKKGMHIEIAKHKGEVTKIELLEIILKCSEDEHIYIPNSKIFSDELIIYGNYNHSHHIKKDNLHSKEQNKVETQHLIKEEHISNLK